MGVDAHFIVGNALKARQLLRDQAPFDAFINMFTSDGYYERTEDLEFFRQLWRMASPGAALVVFTANRDWIIRNFEHEGLGKAEPIHILQRRQLDLKRSVMHNDW